MRKSPILRPRGSASLQWRNVLSYSYIELPIGSAAGKLLHSSACLARNQPRQAADSGIDDEEAVAPRTGYFQDV
jgi:hypothetical protein